jgi:hypothetical protein
MIATDIISKRRGWSSVYLSYFLHPPVDCVQVINHSPSLVPDAVSSNWYVTAMWLVQFIHQF